MQRLSNALKQNLNEPETQIQLQKTVTVKRREKLQDTNKQWNQIVLQGYKRMAQDEEFRKQIDKNLS